MSAPLHILLVDDDAQSRLLVERELHREFGESHVQHVADVNSFARALAAGAIDAAIIDANTHWADGIEILHTIKARHAGCAVIMFTAAACIEPAIAAMKAGLDDYVVKPHACPERLPQLLLALRTCLARACTSNWRRATDEALRESEEHFRLALKNSPVVVFTQDRQLRYTWVYNPSLGYTVQEILGKSDDSLHSREDAARLNALKRDVLQTGRGRREEIKITRDDGIHYFDLTLEPLHDAQGEIAGIACAALDITDRKAAEAELASKARLLAEALHVAHVGSWDMDLESDMITWSDEHYRILGLEPGEIRPSYEQALKFVHPDDLQLVRDTIAATVTQMGSYDIECRVIRADGRERTIRSRGAVVAGADGRPARLLGTAQDITAQKQYEAALQRSEQQLRNALAERRQLSQDLHDNIMQTVCAVGLSLEHSQRLLSEGQAQGAASEIGWASRTLKTVMHEIRHFIDGEEPLLLSASELQAELTELARMIESRELGHFNIDVDPAAASQLKPDEARQVLSIAREAMSNSARHAHATSGTVSLQAQGDAIRFELRDDGIGFDVKRLAHRGEGLKNITARARQIGAQVEVLSQPGHGTRVVLELPLLTRKSPRMRNRRHND